MCTQNSLNELLYSMVLHEKAERNKQLQVSKIVAIVIIIMIICTRSSFSHSIRVGLQEGQQDERNLISPAALPYTTPHHTPAAQLKHIFKYIRNSIALCKQCAYVLGLFSSSCLR